jgi:tetratricopeptide (TPR) repeat protein
MALSAELLATGWRWHQAGDLPRAEQAYRQLVQQEPGHAQGWYLLGSLHQAQSKLPDAIQHYQQALRLQSTFFQAEHDLGVAYLLQRHPAQAEAHFRRAVALQPGFAPAQLNLGLALLQQGRLEEALLPLREAARLQPDSADFHGGLGGVLCGLGRLEEAADSYQRALALRPGWAEAHFGLGNALCGLGRLEEAVAAYRRAVQLRPDYGEAHANLGVALRDAGRPAEAEASYHEAVRLRPQMAEAHNGLGTALLDQDRLAEAADCFHRALQLRPDDALFHFNRAIACLPLGDFENGLAEFEWRFQRPDWHCRSSPVPRWDGSSLSGRTLLMYAEGGLGDTIQFVRYARLAQEQGARVIVECQRPLVRLLARCPGIDHLVAYGDALPPHDVQAPMLSLPYCFRTRLDTIPANMPCLWADPALVEPWRRELAELAGFKIGIAWQGSEDGNRAGRSFPLAEFAPLAAVPGVRLVSLQKGPGSEQVGAVAGHWPLTDLGPRLDETGGAFLDTAAVMMNLDLIVTSDTSIAHLAGALGVPVWLALTKNPEWRWLLEREDTPWYPTMRLFRQKRRGEWGPVFQRIAEAVQRRHSSEPEA